MKTMEETESLVQVATSPGEIDRTCVVCHIKDDRPIHVVFGANVVNGVPVDETHHIACATNCESCKKINEGEE